MEKRKAWSSRRPVLPGSNRFPLAKTFPWVSLWNSLSHSSLGVTEFQFYPEPTMWSGDLGAQVVRGADAQSSWQTGLRWRVRQRMVQNSYELATSGFKYVTHGDVTGPYPGTRPGVLAHRRESGDSRLAPVLWMTWNHSHVAHHPQKWS